jgi:hypothetical protein
MKTISLVTLVAIVPLIGTSQLPEKAGDLVSKLKNWELEQQVSLQKTIHEKRQQVVAALEEELTLTTKSGDLEGALAIKKAIEELAKPIYAGAPMNPPPTGQAKAGAPGSSEVVVIVGEGGKHERNEHCELSREGESFILHTAMANAPVTSRQKFRAPFRMLARAATDGSLRFYFGEGGIVIFNWDSNQEVLRLGDPRTPISDQTGFPGEGELKAGQIYEFEILVEKERIAVVVDGRKRAEMEGDFAEKSVGTIGIGAAFGSKVKVDYFKGIHLGQGNE